MTQDVIHRDNMYSNSIGRDCTHALGTEYDATSAPPSHHLTHCARVDTIRVTLRGADKYRTQ